MKFAFLIMGNFNSKNDTAYTHYGDARIIGDSNLKRACNVEKTLQRRNK